MRAVRWVPPVLVLASLAAVPVSSTVAAGPTRCGGLAPTIVGTGGPDRLTGTKGPDVIQALGGDDLVDGLAGDDVVCGGAGVDRLAGGAGNDSLYGGLDGLGDGPGGTYLVGDLLTGGPDDDLLDGGVDGRAADDRRRPDTYSWADASEGVAVDLSTEVTGVAVGEGSDTIVLGQAHGVVGSAYADTVTGSPGPDRVLAGPGPDTISTGDGADLVYPDGLEGHEGRDVVDTGDGSDLVSSLAGRDAVATGRGADFVEAFGPEPATVDLGSGDDYLGATVAPGSGADAQGGSGDDAVAFYGRLLEGQSPAARFVVDLRTGVTTTSGSVTATGTIGGFEAHRLIGALRWGFFGTEGGERVWAVQGGPLRAKTLGGDDQLTGTTLDDVLDGGSGRDTGYGRGGTDECRSLERGDC